MLLPVPCGANDRERGEAVWVPGDQFCAHAVTASAAAAACPTTPNRRVLAQPVPDAGPVHHDLVVTAQGALCDGNWY
jgi:hypothetical protein